MRPHADFSTSVKKYQYLLTQPPFCFVASVIDRRRPLALVRGRQCHRQPSAAPSGTAGLPRPSHPGRSAGSPGVCPARNQQLARRATGNGREQRTRLRSKMSSTSFVLLGLAAKILNTWNASNAIAWEGSANAFITRRRCRGSAMYRLICRQISFQPG